ncbi:Brix domain-containing protein C1B9.03c [Taphrina deformans PYCC 5710]|uniref:Brix domain-containing protein C1B9.03c n=1 Tax=Taphrina deformans (strain PYCC 5710 / ATCC 11124 / CBS 356.35 / IMI 108563 / JCM 9778 / NBRC 8474) TaxID=1097556 RepID=R4XCV8_TAPDE|nr:Brix domain-containing protein C1B9.03c [Taphrina deformans PYCC 5710]|eukprot:CCG83639.1 Brix domain-containing protein C1B9.03c [Taphrina deformans PYCC 5710]
MAKQRTKKRTHKTVQPSETDGVPKTMVIQTSSATTGKALSQLTKDTRLMMAPNTAVRLKERKNNKLRDYTTMTGPLGVTHLLLFNQSTSGPTLRIARTPRGPTLFFRVREYSLSKDLNKIIRNPKSPGIEFQHAPLLVLNNFSSGTSKEHPEEELLRTTFQNMFPALNTNTASLNTMKRVVLLHRLKNEPGSDIELRHYAINTRLLGQDKKMKKIVSGESRKRNDAVPDLSKLNDVSEFLLGAGYDSASESEYEEDSKISVEPTKAVRVKREDSADTGTSGGEQRGVKLVELGPRMTFSLYKVTSDVSAGAVLYHRDISLTSSELAKQEKHHEQAARIKEVRKAEQIKNVKRKREEAEQSSSRSKRGKLRAAEKESAAGNTASKAKPVEEKDVEDMSEGELEEALALSDDASVSDASED